MKTFPNISRTPPRVYRVLMATLITGLLAIPALPLAAQWRQRGRIPPHISLRGISVVSDREIWVTGTDGTFATTDNAYTWEVVTLREAESFDLRDVHAVSMDTAWVMVAAQDTARIYKTDDRGLTWTLQYDDTRKGVFLDAIAFWDSQHGIALGDQIDGRFLVLITNNGGDTWTPVGSDALPAALPNEAAFAASGSALVTHTTKDGKRLAWFGTGGASSSRVFRTVDGGKKWTVTETPVPAGSPSKGIFSLAFRDAKNGVAVGGDYKGQDTSAVIAAFTTDGGATWKASAGGPSGYLSGVAYLDTPDGKHLIAVGSNGTATSADAGEGWVRIDLTPLNSVTVAPNGGVWAVGPKGLVMLRRNLKP